MASGDSYEKPGTGARLLEHKICRMVGFYVCYCRVVLNSLLADGHMVIHKASNMIRESELTLRVVSEVLAEQISCEVVRFSH